MILGNQLPITKHCSEKSTFLVDKAKEIQVRVFSENYNLQNERDPVDIIWDPGASASRSGMRALLKKATTNIGNIANAQLHGFKKVSTI